MSDPLTRDVHYYFAYGSNMNPLRVEQRQMGFDSADAGRLTHFRLRFNKRSVKYPGAASANVVAHADAVTEGVVYRLTHPAQIEMMDPYEGYPVRYDRRPLPIQLIEGVVQAWVYIANEDHIQEGLAPTRWYLEHLLAGEPYLSSAYLAELRETPCLPDTDLEPE